MGHYTLFIFLLYNMSHYAQSYEEPSPRSLLLACEPPDNFQVGHVKIILIWERFTVPKISPIEKNPKADLKLFYFLCFPL
jgi:hypothetical protein